MLDLSQFSPNVATAIAAIVGIVIALIAFRVGGMVLERATRRMPVIHTMVRALYNPARIAMPLLALQLVWQAAPEQVPFIENIRHVNGLLFIGSLTWLAISAINGITNGVIAQHPSDIDDNLQARRIQTQARVLSRTATLTVLVAGLAIMLMTFPGARQVGASLLASAGVIGLIAGIAAKPVFSNLIAGLQIALAQPIRIDDVLIVEGEWGRVEEITGTYVVLKIWDDRRLIIPLQWFIEKPFQNWTRTGSQLLGSVFLSVDFAMPVAPLRAELERLVPTLPEWDGRFFNLQVTDATERTMQLRILVTAGSSSLAFDLRCKVREAMIDFMQREYPQYLPTLRVHESGNESGNVSANPYGGQVGNQFSTPQPVPQAMGNVVPDGPDGPGASAEVGMAQSPSSPDR